MRTPVDERLRVEAEHFALRFDCEHCAHFDPQSKSCGEGFPCDDHRGVDLRFCTVLVFCKSFELA